MLKKKDYVDVHKLLTPLFIGGLIYYYAAGQQLSAFVILALQGSYAWLWILRSRVFGYAQLNQPTTLFYGAGIIIFLSGYWLAPYIIISQQIPLTPISLAIAMVLYSVGVFILYGTDIQINTALKYSNTLVTDGLVSTSRNMNYLGDLLVYLSFALLSKSWLPVFFLLFSFCIIWVPAMKRKELILKEYKNFAEYKTRSGFFIPCFFKKQKGNLK